MSDLPQQTITNTLKSIEEQGKQYLIDKGILEDEPEIAPDPAIQIAQQAAKIAELEAALNDARVLSEKRPVELPDGQQTTTTEAAKHLAWLKQEVELNRLKTERYLAQLADERQATTPVAAQNPLLNRDTAEALLGRTGWAALSNELKAKVLDTRQGDLDRLKPEEHFGRGSSSQKAYELSRSNPGLYRLLKATAKKAGLI